MTTKRKVGRPKGRRNKVSASDEIQKAISSGAGFVELKDLIWTFLEDDKVSEMQKSKMLQYYLDLLKFLHVEGIKLEDSNKEEAKTGTGVQEGKNTNTPVKNTSTDSNITPMKFGKQR